MLAIFNKEVKSYFQTPVAYLFMAFFGVLSGLIFFFGNIIAGQSDMSMFFSMMSYLWMLLCPVLVMRLIPGERKNNSIALLLTAPIHRHSIILAKFLAAALILTLSVTLTLLYPLLLFISGYAFWPEILVGYLGVILQGLAFIELDLFVSTFCFDILTASVAAFFINMLNWLLALATFPLGNSFFSSILRFFSLFDRLMPFLFGQISFSGICFFLVFCTVFLWGSVLNLNHFSQSSRRAA